jgi:thiosulfate reductase cytochrome b subunit
MIGWLIAGWICLAALCGWLAIYTPKDRIQEELESINEHQRQMKALKKAVSK